VKVVSKPKNFSADSLPYNPHRECREHLHLRQVQVWANPCAARKDRCGAKFCFFSREIRVIRAIRDKKSPTIPTMYGRESADGEIYREGRQDREAKLDFLAIFAVR